MALFPYIPDAQADNYRSLLERIKHEFEQRHYATLRLRPLDPADDFYDLETLRGWLHNQSHQYDLIEVDAILLGELAATKLIAPWGKGLAESDWHPAAKRAVTLFNEVYGVPHFLCGHFVFSTDQRITRAQNITTLTNAIKRSVIGNGRFAGDILGSWNTPALYLDAWQDTHGGTQGNGLLAPLDERIVSKIGGLVRLCAENGKNLCLSGGYDDNDAAAIRLGNGEIAATIGYSERLHPISKALKSTAGLSFNSLPLGEGNKPLVFTDSFVKRTGCVEGCEEAANAFARYLLDPGTQEWILMGRDKQGPAVPRYLLPATQAAYDQPGLRSDRFYRQLRDIVKDAQPYPSFGLYSVRSIFRDAIMLRLRMIAGQ